MISSPRVGRKPLFLKAARLMTALVLNGCYDSRAPAGRLGSLAMPPSIVLSCLAAALASTAVAADRPNVIVILTDDQGSVDAGCYGAEDLQTPGIDSLAASGVRFTQFYAASAVCSPSRAGLMTGRFPLNAGLVSNASSQAGAAGGMPSSQVTMAELFREAGYATAHIGKWHLGYQPDTRPLGQGFQFSFGHMGGCIDNYSHFFYWNGPNRHDLWRNNTPVHRPGEFFPDLMLREAMSFIDDHAEQPFFMYYAMNTPHYPYQGDPHWLTTYQDLPYPRNLYNAFVSTMDARLERLLSWLEKRGLRDNTMIAFQSDHGHSVEVRAHEGGGDNGPFRGHKFTLFEGGIRVPAIISWPGHLPTGVRTAMAHSCDWLPTLAELCGVSTGDLPLDGRSLVPVLRDASQPTPHERLHWIMGQPGPKSHWAVRQGPWKLIANAGQPQDGPRLSEDDRQLMLVHVEEDPGETINQAAQQPDLVRQLQQAHAAWVQAAAAGP